MLLKLILKCKTCYLRDSLGCLCVCEHLHTEALVLNTDRCQKRLKNRRYRASGCMDWQALEKMSGSYYEQLFEIKHKKR